MTLKDYDAVFAVICNKQIRSLKSVKYDVQDNSQFLNKDFILTGKRNIAPPNITKNAAVHITHKLNVD